MVIKIEKECLNFIILQLTGSCEDEASKRLTFISISDEAKELLLPVQKFLLNGESITYSDNSFEKVKKLLCKFKTKVAPPEMNLINYISLILNGSNDTATFLNLERYYNDAIKKQQQTYFKAI